MSLLPRRGLWARLALLVGVGLVPSFLHGAAFPPGLRFRSVATRRVVVHYHQGLEAMARQAASLATEILEAHEARYHVSVGTVQIVLSDVQDDPNGFATPLPYPLVSIRAAAPDGSDLFGNYESWLRLVLTHELSHIVHLDQAHGLLRAGRRVFGRAPYLFPNALTPTWMIEGLATYEETRGTAFGRGRSSDARMIVRVASLEGGVPGEDKAVAALDDWPGGDASYVFGEAFLQDMTDRFGDGTLPELARVHSGRVVPFADDLTSIRVTGASFHTRWREWVELERVAAEHEAERIRARGLTASRSITEAGIRQLGPRFSPDGSWIAYSRGTLTRFPSIHLVRPDGSGDHRLTDRNGGRALSWSADGSILVYDQPEVVHFFSVYSDLCSVDVRTGRVRRLTSGLRAHAPDVSVSGSVIFVRRLADRSELAVVGLDGSGLKDLTRSPPGTQFGEPHWSPSGDRIVASRWTTGGWLDLVAVEPDHGEVESLTHGRFRDLEPVFTHDGAHILFRSDRDGVSNLYALRLADKAILRVTNVLGGAFDPDVSPFGTQVVFSSYGVGGYDVHIMDLDLAGLSPAEPVEDPFAAPRADPAPAPEAARPYHASRHLLPRFWSPFAAYLTDEWVYGVATGGGDPLFQNLYAVEAHRGAETGRVSAQGVYQYDRFWPTLLLAARDTTELQSDASFLRKQEVALSATLPVQRGFRCSQSLSLAYRRRRDTVSRSALPGRLDLGGLELGWALGSAKQYPYSISPVDGWRLSVTGLKEARALGSQLSIERIVADARAYLRVGTEDSTLALRAGGGATLGQPRFKEAFDVGGFPSGVLFDIAETNVSVLRGYPDDLLRGRSVLYANAEYRVPLAHPQGGWRSLPFFLRHVHAAVFADAADAWSGPFQLKEVRTAAGVALGLDSFVSHNLPVTATAGVARGLSHGGETRFYARLGLAF